MPDARSTSPDVRSASSPALPADRGRGTGVSARPDWVGHSRSARQTRDMAAFLARVAEPGDRIGLIGELGVGKTEFARGFAAGLGVAAVVSSPTFTLMSEYEGRLALFHIDVYRLAGTEDALAGGLFDERQEEGVSLIEWADRLDGVVGSVDLEVSIAGGMDGTRELRLVGSSPAGARYVAAARRRDGAPRAADRSRAAKEG